MTVENSWSRKGEPTDSANYQHIAAVAESFLAGAYSKLSGEYSSLAQLSYSTYTLYKAYQASPFQGTLAVNARAALNWNTYRSDAAWDQARATQYASSEEEVAEASELTGDFGDVISGAMDAFSKLIP